GTLARLVAESDTEPRLSVWRSSADARKFMRECDEPFGAPKSAQERIEVAAQQTPEHQMILQDFVDAILEGRGSESLIAPASAGVRAVELGNAIQMAALSRRIVELPLDTREF